ncbi:MAG: hypothetical protein AAB691_03205, partial [Patescibacteria group bacterium]
DYRTARTNFINLITDCRRLLGSLRCVQDRTTSLRNLANIADDSVFFGSIVNSASLTEGRVEITTQTPLRFPISTLYIKADSVGIYTPVPDIQFVSSPSSQCFATGSGNGIITVEIEYVGDERGGFSDYASL